jgi:hypothetical protein
MKALYLAALVTLALSMGSCKKECWTCKTYDDIQKTNLLYTNEVCDEDFKDNYYNFGNVQCVQN